MADVYKNHFYLFFLLNFINFEISNNLKISPLIWRDKTFSSDKNLMYYMRSKRLNCIFRCWMDTNCFYVVFKNLEPHDLCHFYNYNLVSNANFSVSSNSNVYLKSNL